MSESQDQEMTSGEWKGTLLGLGVVLSAGVLIESTPRGDYGQIVTIIGCALVVGACCMVVVRTFSRNPAPSSVSLKAEVNTNGYARV
ncbi:MAG: hypothetical protein FD131_3347 [Rhodocyclaceae bacterium]|nr:MAG: hypothetical protein FD131_3347 [Rhodocyclaceae bacterium]